MKWATSCLGIILTAVLYCEFVADYLTLLRCSKPTLSNTDGDKVLSAMLLADTHLLGPLRGHWLDKLYREWHMRRTFQAAMALFQPEVVFVLGDLFDEGEFVDDKEFTKYKDRFHRHFRTPDDIPVISAVGNHDIGFHYKLHPYLTERFEEHFNNTAVRMYTVKDTHFVFINSMALENDGCYFCESAVQELNTIAVNLDCLRNSHTCADKNVLRVHKSYSRPVIMQHFPTYRVSDAVCNEYDSPVLEDYRENWEVLSQKSTVLLGELLQPRLAFAGHSHHYCRNINMLGIEEFTIASFNWRNKVDPSFLLAHFTASQHDVRKCNMLHQQTVYNTYCAAVTACIIIALYHCYYQRFHNKYRKSYKII